jgi:hypothetical protein
MTNTVGRRLAATTLTSARHGLESLSGSILPPVPFTYKVTRGNTAVSKVFAGDPGQDEKVDSRYY